MPSSRNSPSNLQESKDTASPGSAVAVVRYSTIAQLLHWLTALLVVAAYVVSIGGPETRVYAAADDFSRGLHELLGVSVFALTLVRMSWRAIFPPPKEPEKPAWMAHGACLFVKRLERGRFLWPTPAGEVFMSAGKPGAALETACRDAAVAVSIALQHGAPLDTLRHAVTTAAQPGRWASCWTSSRRPDGRSGDNPGLRPHRRFFVGGTGVDSRNGCRDCRKKLRVGGQKSFPVLQRKHITRPTQKVV